MVFLTIDNLKRILTKLKSILDTKAGLVHTHETSDIKTTSSAGFITDAERVQYSDKYTKLQTDTLVTNMVNNYVPLTKISTEPTANKIPVADSSGKISSNWLSSLNSLKLGENYESGYVEIKSDKTVVAQAGIEESLGKTLSLYGGGIDNSAISSNDTTQGSIILTGANLGTQLGGSVYISAGDGGNDITSSGGDVTISSGKGNFASGKISLDNYNIKNNSVYIENNPLTIESIDTTNKIKTSLFLDNTKFSLSRANTYTGSSDFNFSISSDGTVSGTHLNSANNLVKTDSTNKIPRELIPNTELVNSIGDFSAVQTINPTNGSVVIGNIVINTEIAFSDTVPTGEFCKVTLILTNSGSFSVTWPANLVWAKGDTPSIPTDTVSIIELTKVGGSNWYGYEVGEVNEISFGSTELPPTEVKGSVYTQVLSTVVF